MAAQEEREVNGRVPRKWSTRVLEITSLDHSYICQYKVYISDRMMSRSLYILITRTIEMLTALFGSLVISIVVTRVPATASVFYNAIQ
ncbi:hypothetical protein LOAG_02475, partial [Loa loa]